MINQSTRIRKISRSSLIISGFLAIPLLGTIDYWTGSDLSFSIFYLIPIFMIVWFSGQPLGILAAFVSATTWLVADAGLPLHASQPLIHYWNATIRLGYFSIFVSLLSRFRNLNRELEAKVEERTQSLGRQEHLLRLFVENSPAAIAMFDRDMKYVVASHRYLSDYELGNQDIVGHSHYEIFPEIPERWIETYEKCLAGATERVEEDPFPRASGRLDWVRWEIRPWYETNGTVGGIILFSEVITERKQAEAKIQEQIAHLNALRTIDMFINSSFDLHMTLNTVLNQVVSQLNVDAATVLVYNQAFQALEYAAIQGFRTQPDHGHYLRLNDGLPGRAIMEHNTVHIPNLAESGIASPRMPMLAAESFVTYIGLPLITKGKVEGVLEIFHRTQLEPDQDWRGFLETLAGQAAIAIDNGQLFQNLQRSNAELSIAYDATIEGWSRAMDLRDKETEGHTLRVTQLTLNLAHTMDIPEADILHMRRGALLHDIGKMGVPDGILLKPDKLTEQEWAIMRKHPVFAYEMLAPIQYLKSAAINIPYCHHEKWDGTGYPRGLQTEQIPLSARIFAVADVWDAVTSDRPYRAAWSRKQALDYIREQSGKYFDPAVVEVFLGLMANQSLASS